MQIHSSSAHIISCCPAVRTMRKFAGQQVKKKKKKTSQEVFKEQKTAFVTLGGDNIAEAVFSAGKNQLRRILGVYCSSCIAVRPASEPDPKPEPYALQSRFHKEKCFGKISRGLCCGQVPRLPVHSSLAWCHQCRPCFRAFPKLSSGQGRLVPA